MWSSPFLKRPRPVLQLSQSRPRGLPVSWSWSTTIFTLTPAMLSRRLGIFSWRAWAQRKISAESPNVRSGNEAEL